MPSALIVLAEGGEEMEIIIVADMLRRAGINVTIGGLEGANPINCINNIKIVPDKPLTDALKAAPYDAIVCPGGEKGPKSMIESAAFGKALQEQEKAGRTLAAVCSGPTIFVAHGVGKGKKMTSHPAVKDKFKGYATYVEDRVVVDGKLITSRGPGTCFEFSLAIIEQMVGKDKAQALIAPLLLKV